MDNQWLLDLKAKIADVKDAKNFDDIIKCYQNGLLRAGFLMAWLMLVESLKRKIVTLADKEVKVAIDELKKITSQEEKMHSNDEFIWIGAEKCGLISREEESVIELLWEKRCIMSHPYMPEVKESDFRYMVENLVSVSLSKTLVWSKVMIEDFINNLKNNVFLIPDEIDEKREKANQIIALIPKNLYPFYWKTVFYEHSLAIEKSHKKVQQMLLVMAMMFVKKVENDINEPMYGLEARVRDYCVSCWTIFYPEKIWPYLNAEYQGQMFRFLKDNKTEAKKVLGCAHSLVSRCRDLDSKYISCYYEALSHYDVTDFERYYINKDLFLKRLYEEIISRGQWEDQKKFIDMLSSMDENDMTAYNPNQIERLGRYLAECCYNDTFKAQDFVKERNLWTKNRYFAKGFVLEGMSETDGSLRISRKHMEFVLIVLYRQNEAICRDIFEALDALPVDRFYVENMISDNIKLMIRKYFDDKSYQYKALAYLVGKYYKGKK